MNKTIVLLITVITCFAAQGFAMQPSRPDLAECLLITKLWPIPQTNKAAQKQQQKELNRVSYQKLFEGVKSQRTLLKQVLRMKLVDAHFGLIIQYAINKTANDLQNLQQKITNDLLPLVALGQRKEEEKAKQLKKLQKLSTAINLELRNALRKK